MRRRYDKQGILALYPQAFWDLFIEVESPEVTTVGDCSVIEIRGPLEHHDDWWCDSYEAIVDRVTAACEAQPSTIILKIDSPGGELFGCFDAARTMRARAKAAGKKLIAYVDGCACSAGYALACAAEQIVTSETAFTGSIGILISRVDVTARDSREGVGFALVASGKRKVDGNPHASLTQDELSSMQAQCDSLAELFFELVASLRGLSVDAIRSLEAGVFHGPRAVEVGLADRVASFDELLAMLANGGIEVMAGENTEPKDGEERPTPSSSQQDVDDAREALRRAANDGDERAARALEVLEGGDDESSDDDEGGESASASATPPARAARAAAPRVSAESAGVLGRTVAELSRKVTKLEADKEAIERKALLESRPDLGKELVEHLATMSLADARAIVDRIPKPDAPPAKKPAATAVVPATRGAGQGDNVPAPSAQTSDMDRAFGMLKPQGGVKREGVSLVFETPRNGAVPTRGATPANPSTEKGTA